MFSFDFSVRPGEIVPLHKSPVVLQPRLFPLHANLLFSLTFAFINENAESRKKKWFGKSAFMGKKTACPFVLWVTRHLCMGCTTRPCSPTPTGAPRSASLGWVRGAQPVQRAGSCPAPCLRHTSASHPTFFPQEKPMGPHPAVPLHGFT